MKSPRVLVVRVGAMGDVLHGLPAVAALRAAWPDAHIAWAVEPRWAALLQASGDAAAGSAAMPVVDHVHLVEAKAWSKRPVSLATARSVAGLRRELRDARYDVAIDLQGTIRSGVIAWMSGAARVVGSVAPREVLAARLYAERVRLTKPHVVEQAAELVSAAMRKTVLPTCVDLPIDATAEAWCDALVGNDGRRMVFLAPTAGWGAKQWPAERFGALAAKLHGLGYRVLVNASPFGRDEVADRVIAASGGVAEGVPCSLAQLIAVVRRVGLVIAGDSGPLHLAAGLRVPVVALFGPTDPARNGPWDVASRVLRDAGSITDHRRHAATEAGLGRIGLDAVLAATVALLDSPVV